MAGCFAERRFEMISSLVELNLGLGSLKNIAISFAFTV